MKKFLTLVLVFIITISASSCGNKNKTKPASNDGTNNTKQTVESSNKDQSVINATSNNSNSNFTNGIYKNEGEELSDWFNAFNSVHGSFEKAVNNFSTEDFGLFDVGMDYLAPMLQLSAIGLYDSLEILGKDKGEYREKKGSIIDFGKSFTRDADGFSPNDKKGDVITEKGSLDTSSNIFLLESYVERNGEIVDRTVTEVVMLQEDSFLIQCLKKSFSQIERGIEDTGKAYFMLCDNDRMEVIYATFQPNVNFQYESIAEKGMISPEDMAQGYEIVRKLTVENDKASAEKY